MATRKTQTITPEMSSVVIPTFKRTGLALQAAKYIRKFHPKIEIIIVDQQNSAPISEKDQNDLKITYLNLKEANTSAAKNAGIKKSTGEIIFFFDDDVEITKDTIPAQLHAYQNEEVIGTAGRVINDNESIPDNTDVETGKTNNLATKFSFQFWSTKEQTVDFPYGCNMSFKRKILNKINGFDEQFSQAFEEIDLALRARVYGDIQFVPNSLAFHHKAPSGGTRQDKLNSIRMKYFFYGVYIAKQVPVHLVLISMILRSKSAFSEHFSAIFSFWRGFFSYRTT